MYHVGPGRGCGGIAVFRDGKAHVSSNWARVRTLYNGPVQTAFEVSYAPWNVGGGMKAAETRKVTLDAGSHFTRVRSSVTLHGVNSSEIRVDAGMDTGKKRNSYEVVTADREAGIVAAWSRPRGDNGSFGTAVMVPWAPDGAAEDGEG